MVDAMREFLNEVLRGLVGALANHEHRDELRVGADRGPGPHVANAVLTFARLGNVLFFRIAERPNLVALNLGAGEIAHHAILINPTRGANVQEELADRVDTHVAHARRGSHRVAFNEALQDSGAFSGA